MTATKRARRKAVRNEKTLQDLKSKASQKRQTNRFHRYRNDPVGFARDVLRIILTDDQATILLALLKPPFRVMVKSGHNVGKSFIAAVAIIWWYYTRDPSWTASTAPTKKSVKEILWAEIRLLLQRANLPTSLQPADPTMRDSPDHQATGDTSQNGEAFQGRHRLNMLFVLDEAEGVASIFWTAITSMFRPFTGDAVLAILNPTTTTSQSYIEETSVDADGNPKWTIFELSALDHPNIEVGLRNRELSDDVPDEPLPIPAAITLDQLEGFIADWCEPVNAGEEDFELDFEFPPASGIWHRPDPDGESRILGRRPTSGSAAVWTERLWERSTNPPKPLAWSLADRPVLSCDVARFGSDKTEMHVRCGPCSIHHEDHGGWDIVRTADRMMELADEYAAWINAQRDPHAHPIDPKTLRIVIDDTGVGGGVTDILSSHKYSVLAVNAGCAALQRDKYPRVRDELWFGLRERARKGQLDLSRLPAKRLAKLKQQALAPIWWPTPDRRRQVESKEDTMDRIGRSPDGLDSMNLAYYSAGGDLPEFIERKTR